MGELGSASVDKPFCPGQKIILHPMYHPKLSSWLNLRVFYVRVSNCQIDEMTPDQLILYHIPLTPDTIIDMNGERSSMYSDFFSSTLRRDRVDKRSEEATFVSTDSISITGNVRFEVYDRDCLLLTGVLELCNSNGLSMETKKHQKNWSINCQFEKPANIGFVKSKKILNADTKLPVVEVYVAGCFYGSPIIFTKTLHFGVLKKHQRKVRLGSIPENETIELKKEMASMEALQVTDALVIVYFIFPHICMKKCHFAAS